MGVGPYCSTSNFVQHLSPHWCNSRLPAPSDYRPITITSVVLGHFHKMLASRLQKGISLSPEQRAFVDQDGLTENLSLLSEVLHPATTNFKPLYTADINVRKAIDMVQHVPLINILRARGTPYLILRNIFRMYESGTTSIQIPGGLRSGIQFIKGSVKGIRCRPTGSTW